MGRRRLINYLVTSLTALSYHQLSCNLAKYIIYLFCTIELTRILAIAVPTTKWLACFEYI
jgi:hypothetical protein